MNILKKRPVTRFMNRTVIIHGVIKKITHCISYFSVSIIKYSDKKQLKEEVTYFSLWFPK